MVFSLFQYLDEGSIFPFGPEVRYVLCQYPDLVERYSNAVAFSDRKLENIEMIFDLFDYQTQLRPIRNAVLNMFENNEDRFSHFGVAIERRMQSFALEELGVEI
jgi:hypothetical protein